MRPPDLRSDTIFTPLDKRQKSKFTPSETSTSEIRYYLTSWTKGKKTNLLHLRPPHLRSDTSPPPDEREKGKKANLLHLRPPDLRFITIFTNPDKRQKSKFTPSETFRSEIRYPPSTKGKNAKRQIYSI